MNVNWTYCSVHFTNYTNVKSSETNIMLYVNYISIEAILQYNYTCKYNSHIHVYDTFCFMKKHYQRKMFYSKQVFIVEYCCIILIV